MATMAKTTKAATKKAAAKKITTKRAAVRTAAAAKAQAQRLRYIPNVLPRTSALNVPDFNRKAAQRLIADAMSSKKGNLFGLHNVSLNRLNNDKAPAAMPLVQLPEEIDIEQACSMYKNLSGATLRLTNAQLDRLRTHYPTRIDRIVIA